MCFEFVYRKFYQVILLISAWHIVCWKSFCLSPDVNFYKQTCKMHQYQSDALYKSLLLYILQYSVCLIFKWIGWLHPRWYTKQYNVSNENGLHHKLQYWHSFSKILNNENTEIMLTVIKQCHLSMYDGKIRREKRMATRQLNLKCYFIRNWAKWKITLIFDAMKNSAKNWNCVCFIHHLTSIWSNVSCIIEIFHSCLWYQWW